MPRIARGLYTSPHNRARPPDGGLNLPELVGEARQVCRFEQLFGQGGDLVQLVQDSVQRRGWTLRRSEIFEAVEEFA